MHLALLGCGKIGEALLMGLLNSKLFNHKTIVATTRHTETADSVSKRLGIEVHTDNLRAVKHADLVILATKPSQSLEVCRGIRAGIPRNALVISLATGVPTTVIESLLRPKTAVVRAMPNTPIVIARGMTVLCRGTHVNDEQLQLVHKLFATVGEVAHVEEELMDAVTGLSASGPAYIYVIIESLAEAGVKVGLPRELATKLAAQTVLGAASLQLATGKHPALLKDSVTTPAGVTIDGLMELEEGGLRVTLIKAIVMSTRRAAEIQDKLVKSLPKPSTSRHIKS